MTSCTRTWADSKGQRWPNPYNLTSEVAPRMVIGGLAAFVGLYVLAAIFGTRSIERELTGDTERALSAALPASSYDVSFSGRDARLVADDATDVDNLEAARRVVLDVDGVRTVDVDEAVSAGPAVIRVTAERDGDGVTLTGTVLSDAERLALVAAGQAAVGAAAVDDRVEVADDGVPTAAADGALTRLADVVAAFGGVTEARATLDGTTLTVSGVASTDDGAAAVNAALAAASDAGLIAEGRVGGPGSAGAESSDTTGADGESPTVGGAGRNAGGGSGPSSSLGGSGGPAGSIATILETGSPSSSATPAGGVAVEARRDDAGIALSGIVLSDQQRSALVTAAGQAVGPGAVTDELAVAPGSAPTAADDTRVIHLSSVVALFEGLVAGDATLTDARLVVVGEAVDGAAVDALEAAVATAQAAGLSVSTSITVSANGDAAATVPRTGVPATAGPLVTIPTSTVGGSAAVLRGPGAPVPAIASATSPFRSTASSATAIGS